MPAIDGLNDSILAAKLHRPRVTGELVVRSRLLTLLDEGLSRPMTMVVAPAGFGKSTLVSSWAAELVSGKRPGISIAPTAWISLDETDSDLDIFLRYFVAAIRTLSPNAVAKTMSLLMGPQQPAVELLARTLSNEIEALPSSFVIVLDDCHTLQGNAVFDLLAGWAIHWPRQLHLVLISRTDPSLPLTSLRAKSRVVEVRSRELRFTRDETAVYLDRTLGTPLESSAVETIQQRMEGWIAGIKLVTLSPEVRSDLQALPDALVSGDKLIAAYIFDEVLGAQSTEMRKFLLRISIATQFSESLGRALVCDDIPGCDVGEYLDYLETNELFISGLDRRHEWYRLHPLFRDQLRSKLVEEESAETVNTLHRRAARWYGSRGLIDQALYHAQECHDTALMAEFMHQGICEVLNKSDRHTLERWLSMLPNVDFEHSPELLLIRTWDYALRWELDSALHTVEKAEALLNESDSPGKTETSILRGQIAIVKAQDCYFNNRPERAVELCRDTLSLMPEGWVYVRGLAVVFLSSSLSAMGRSGEAERFLKDEYSAATDKSGAYAQRLQQARTFNALQMGHLETAQQIAEVSLHQSVQSGHTLNQGWAHYFLGYIALQWNKLEVAEKHFLAAADPGVQTQLLVARNSKIGLAIVYQAQGNTEQAQAEIDRLSQFDIELTGHQDLTTLAAHARLHLMRGDLAAADMWSEQIALPPAEQPLQPWIDEPLFTRIRVLIARNGPGDLETALKSLDVLDELAGRTFNTRPRAEILALRALAQLTQGSGDLAKTSLIRSVEMARRTGQRRLYVDMGSTMYKLLVQITNHYPTSATVESILLAFEDGPLSTQLVNNRPALDGKSDTNGNITLPDRLTQREMQILKLMAEPLSLGEISTRLYIAPSTVKRHSINIYQKLGVHSRWQAVAAAKELGILPPR